jgi:hypothetical protein
LSRDTAVQRWGEDANEPGEREERRAPGYRFHVEVQSAMYNDGAELNSFYKMKACARKTRGNGYTE